MIVIIIVVAKGGGVSFAHFNRASSICRGNAVEIVGNGEIPIECNIRAARRMTCGSRSGANFRRRSGVSVRIRAVNAEVISVIRETRYGVARFVVIRRNSANWRIIIVLEDLNSEVVIRRLVAGVPG